METLNKTAIIPQYRGHLDIVQLWFIAATLDSYILHWEYYGHMDRKTI